MNFVGHYYQLKGDPFRVTIYNQLIHNMNIQMHSIYKELHSFYTAGRDELQAEENPHSNYITLILISNLHTTFELQAILSARFTLRFLCVPR